MMNYDFEYTYHSQNEDDIQRMKNKYLNDEDLLNKAMSEIALIDAKSNKQILQICFTVVFFGVLVLLMGFYLVLTTMDSSIYVLGAVCGIMGILIIVITLPLYRFLKGKYKKINTTKVREFLNVL